MPNNLSNGTAPTDTARMSLAWFATTYRIDSSSESMAVENAAASGDESGMAANSPATVRIWVMTACAARPPSRASLRPIKSLA